MCFNHRIFSKFYEGGKAILEGVRIIDQIYFYQILSIPLVDLNINTNKIIEKISLLRNQDHMNIILLKLNQIIIENGLSESRHKLYRIPIKVIFLI